MKRIFYISAPCSNSTRKEESHVFYQWRLSCLWKSHAGQARQSVWQRSRRPLSRVPELPLSSSFLDIPLLPVPGVPFYPRAHDRRWQGPSTRRRWCFPLAYPFKTIPRRNNTASFTTLKKWGINFASLFLSARRADQRTPLERWKGAIFGKTYLRAFSIHRSRTKIIGVNGMLIQKREK